MKFKGKGVNLQAVVECCCYMIFSVLLFRLTASGKYLNYVTPRMKPYLYGLSFLMFLWAVSEGRHLLTPRYKVRLSRTFVLVIPILLLLGPKPVVEGSSMIRNYNNSGLTGFGNGQIRKTSNQDYGAGYDGYNQQAPGAGYDSSDQQIPAAGYDSSDQQIPAAGYDRSDQQAPAAGYDSSGQQAPAAGYGGSNQQAAGSGGSNQQAAGYGDPKNNLLKPDSSSLKGLDKTTKTITIADEDYYTWMVELGTYPQKYEGYTVIAKGFVYRDSEVLKNCNFALVRLSMWCCSADLMPLGFMIDYGGQIDFKDNDWVVVTGTLGLGADGSIHLKASNLKAGTKPKEEYVYPF